MIRMAYNLALGAGMLAAAPWLAARLARGRYRDIALARLGLGRAWLPEMAEPGCIWLHALSVGETASALPLLKALGQRFPDKPLAFSVATAQGRKVARESLAGITNVRLFVRPLDAPWSVRRLLDRLKPSLFCLVEGDIWPNWQWELKRRRVPCLLVNNRVSPRTYKGYCRLGGLSRELFAGFDCILAQTGVDRKRLLAVGIPEGKVAVGGNLKFDSAPPELGPEEKQSLAEELGLSGRRVLAAGSTHQSEEEPCLDAFAQLKRGHEGLALLLAPREIDRGGEVMRLARARGLSAARLSEGGAGPGRGGRHPGQAGHPGPGLLPGQGRFRGRVFGFGGRAQSFGAGGPGGAGGVRPHNPQFFGDGQTARSGRGRGPHPGRRGTGPGVGRPAGRQGQSLRHGPSGA